MKVDAHRRIPLGSYVRDLMNFKLTGEQQKVLAGLRMLNQVYGQEYLLQRENQLRKD